MSNPIAVTASILLAANQNEDKMPEGQLAYKKQDDQCVILIGQAGDKNVLKTGDATRSWTEQKIADAISSTEKKIERVEDIANGVHEAISFEDENAMKNWIKSKKIASILIGETGSIDTNQDKVLCISTSYIGDFVALELVKVEAHDAHDKDSGKTEEVIIHEYKLGDGGVAPYGTSVEQRRLYTLKIPKQYDRIDKIVELKLHNYPDSKNYTLEDLTQDYDLFITYQMDETSDQAKIRQYNIKVPTEMYIRQPDVPDYWWDGFKAQELEAMAINLTNHPTKDQVDALLWKTESSFNSLLQETELSFNNLLQEMGSSFNQQLTEKPTEYIFYTIKDFNYWKDTKRQFQNLDGEQLKESDTIKFAFWSEDAITNTKYTISIYVGGTEYIKTISNFMPTMLYPSRYYCYIDFGSIGATGTIGRIAIYSGGDTSGPLLFTNRKSAQEQYPWNDESIDILAIFLDDAFDPLYNSPYSVKDGSIILIRDPSEPNLWYDAIGAKFRPLSGL